MQVSKKQELVMFQQASLSNSCSSWMFFFCVRFINETKLSSWEIGYFQLFCNWNYRDTQVQKMARKMDRDLSQAPRGTGGPSSQYEELYRCLYYSSFQVNQLRLS